MECLTERDRRMLAELRFRGEVAIETLADYLGIDETEFKKRLKELEKEKVVKISDLGGVSLLIESSSNRKVRELFLKLWDKAVDSKKYNKKEWKQLRQFLYQRRVDLY